MRRLFLIRHAKTQPQGAMADFERRLLPRGHADARRLAAWFQQNRQSADALVHSTATRAVETADALAESWLEKASRQAVAELYGAPWRAILGCVRAFPATTHSAAIVAHNPGMFDVANILTGAGDPAARARLTEKMPPCGCAVLDFSIDSWAKLEPGAGRLSLFLTPDGF
jgi:phosphohistidine phosphatase